MATSPKQVAMALASTLLETRTTIIEGHAYAALMGQGVDLETFQTGVRALVDSGLATVNAHQITGTAELWALHAEHAPKGA